MPGRAASRSVIPGFTLTLGITITMLSAVVLIPLAAVFFKAAGLGFDGFAAAALSDRAMRAYRLTFGTAMLAAAINTVFGLALAWVLVRYRFPGRQLISALVDLPFALPTAVAGIALTALYGPSGWIGRYLTPLGIDVAFTPLGIVMALVFVGLPFTVRTVEPVLADLGADVEEAAASLGASRWQTFARVILPAILPALGTGFALGLARGIGEYGSVIFIAGNMPYRTEIAPLLIVVQLEQDSVGGAAAIAVTMLALSFALLLGINLVQAFQRRRMGAA
ncbi:sulfate ABC transporter permease subunit CysT [Sandarakinorhabdus sp.]|uniref:sulfate ABC transporter permease subunit CysT n=1 Tax=Sandarakinorhabdus sp. TaxID=1916663 RepID=UPI00286EAAD2|nr:sulfate ABC transporter permease subunit CysT [Sandarakinorhabdus sp.]